MRKILTGLLLMIAITSCRKSEIVSKPSPLPEGCTFGVETASPLMRSYGSGSIKKGNKKNSKNVIYLDFDGFLISGTTWNDLGIPVVNTVHSGLTPADQQEIFDYVAEAFDKFDVLVTTDSTKYLSASFGNKTREVFTQSHSWYGNVGGVAYHYGSFLLPKEAPCFVFTAALAYNIDNIKRAAVHELGHTLGLKHQSICDNNVRTAAYNPGDATTAPFMGWSYGKIGKWITGMDQFCETQNDTKIIKTSLKEK